MKIYLAARYGRRQEMLRYRRELEEMGIVVTSRWVTGQHEGRLETTIAVEDLEDVRAADLLIAFTEDADAEPRGRARGGRHVELGYALAAGKRVFVVGHLENVFCYLPSILYCRTWNVALDTLLGVGGLVDWTS